jgi:hypothetical protein
MVRQEDVKAFGEKVFDVIEAEPDRLREVTGVGPMGVSAKSSPAIYVTRVESCPQTKSMLCR